MLSRYEGLTDEQLAFQQLCRDFTDREILLWLAEHRDDEWNAPPHEWAHCLTDEVVALMKSKGLDMPEAT